VAREILTFSSKMKAKPIVGALLVIVTQVVTFLGLMSAMAMIARWHNRFPPEIFFGVTLYYGTILIIGLFIVCGLISFLSTRPFAQWCAIFAGLLAWLSWLWPSFETRPFAMPSIFILGAVILIIGSGFGVPYFRRMGGRKNNGEQDITPDR